MFKALIKVVIFFFFIIINITLFTWIVNQLSVEFTPLEATALSSEVQTKQAKINLTPTSKSNIYKPKTNQKNSTYVTPLDDKKPIQQVTVSFDLKNTYLKKPERIHIEKVLQNLQITSSHSIKILSNVPTSSSKEHSNFLMMTKLRIQSVARVIYPYTQNIKMYYHFPVEDNKVVIKIFEP